MCVGAAAKAQGTRRWQVQNVHGRWPAEQMEVKVRDEAPQRQSGVVARDQSDSADLVDCTPVAFITRFLLCEEQR